MWCAAWLFTIEFLHLSFWRGVLAIILWAYYVGAHFARRFPLGRMKGPAFPVYDWINCEIRRTTSWLGFHNTATAASNNRIGRMAQHLTFPWAQGMAYYGSMKCR